MLVARLFVVVVAAEQGCAWISDQQLSDRLDLDGDGVPRPDDCDDGDSAVGLAGDLYADADGDGFGAGAPTQGCVEVAGFVDNGDDCDDLRADVTLNDWFVDADDDGHGDASQGVTTCDAPEGYAADGDDCDDTDGGAFPGAVEVASDGIDQDCDGADTVGITSAFGGELLWVDAGDFNMGSGPSDKDDAYTDHKVTLSNAFWMGRAEVTQAQWAAWVDVPASPGASPSFHAACPSCPVEQVSWREAAQYANALSDAEGLDRCYEEDGTAMVEGYVADPYGCPGYRLPTEAEWEFAARAGESTSWSGSDVAADVAWTVEVAGGASHEGCGLLQDAWDLCDLSGNVAEWVNDGFEEGYSRAAVTDPAGPSTAATRGIRDGNWGYAADTARLSMRYDGGQPGRCANKWTPTS